MATGTDFSAVVLAGGASTRMGRDKAWIEVDGQPSIRRQIDLARASGAGEVWISGRADTDYSALGVPVLHDRIAGLGPLAGVHRALETVRGDPLLVLAVDLPKVTPEVLRALAVRCRPGRGIVPVANGRWQPLAAFYPLGMAPRAAMHLAEGRLAMRDFVRWGLDEGHLELADAGPEGCWAFANRNEPGDWVEGTVHSEGRIPRGQASG